MRIYDVNWKTEGSGAANCLRLFFEERPSAADVESAARAFIAAKIEIVSVCLAYDGQGPVAFHGHGGDIDMIFARFGRRNGGGTEDLIPRKG